MSLLELETIDNIVIPKKDNTTKLINEPIDYYLNDEANYLLEYQKQLKYRHNTIINNILYFSIIIGILCIILYITEQINKDNIIISNIKNILLKGFSISLYSLFLIKIIK